MSDISIPYYTGKLMERYKFASMVDSGELWWYNDNRGVWQPTAKAKIGIEAEKEFPAITTHESKELENKIIRRTPKNRNAFNNHIEYMNCLNGMIELETGNILPHSPRYYSISQLPIKYDQDADCPKVRQFISEILSSEDQEVLWELFGFLLFPSYQIHKAFIFFGASGHNGKTTLIKLMTEFIGIENCSNIELQDLGDDIFATACIYGKLANIADDLSSKAMQSAGKIKQLTGESPISAQNKYEKRFEFVNKAKMVFACNRIPAAPKDADEPFYRRWIILNFCNQFLGKSDNKNIKNEITSPNELSGLLNIAIEQYKKLNTLHEFSIDDSPDKLKRQFLAGSNDSIGRFLVDQIVFDHSATTMKLDIYKTYCEYCENNSMVIKDDNAFFRKFKEYCPDISEVFVQINGSRHRSLRGISLVC